MSDPTDAGGLTNVGGARWCEEHQRWECTSRKSRERGDCHAIAVAGTSKCRRHAGVAPDVARAQGQARITAFGAMAGLPGIEPGRAVLGMLHMSWLRVHLYAGLLEQQVEDEADEPVGEFAWSSEPGGVSRQPSPAGVAGLIGHTYSADKMAGIFASGEARRALVDLEAQERDRCVRYAKTAHDMGIAEREVRLAEQQGQLLASVIRNVLGDLDLSEEQQERVPRVVQARLLEVTQLEATGGAA